MTHLSDAHLPAGQQEVLHVPPALGRIQLGLERINQLLLIRRFKTDSSSYHSRRGHVYGRHGPGPDMVCDVAQDDAVLQRRRQVVGEADAQARLHVLPQAEDVGLGRGGLFSLAAAEVGTRGGGGQAADVVLREAVGGGGLRDAACGGGRAEGGGRSG